MQCVNMHAQDDGIDIRSVPSLEISPIPHDSKAKIAMRKARYMSLLLVVREDVCVSGWEGWGSQTHMATCAPPDSQTDRTNARRQGESNLSPASSGLRRPILVLLRGHISTGMYI